MRFRAMLAALLVFASVSSFARPNLVVNVSLADRSTVADRDVLVDVVFTNAGTSAATFVNWFLPDGELDGDMFLVSRDGQPVSYLGPIVKRAAPAAQDLITLAPGESIARTADLGSVYDLSAAGVYSIQYGVSSSQLYGAARTASMGNPLRDELATEAVIGTDQLLSNEVVSWMDARKSSALEASRARAAVDTVASVGTSSIAYSGRCSATQQATIVDAVAAASSMANGAVSYLSGTPSATQRYTTWFGTYSSANWNEVKGHFVNIKDVFDNKPMTIDCGCKKSYYAYVYPNQPYKIYVCRAFWNAPLTGTDSKGGTLVHETSHFTVVAGTDDFAYGQTAAKQLAITDPAKARFNADSHEYFAENTPPLP